MNVFSDMPSTTKKRPECQNTVQRIPRVRLFSAGSKLSQVVVAKIQQITVKEFLPAIGIPYKQLRKTKPLLSTPDISIEFATAAFRFGHDLVPNQIGKFVTAEVCRILLHRLCVNRSIPKPCLSGC